MHKSLEGATVGSAAYNPHLTGVKMNEKMTKERASAIQVKTATGNGGKVPKGSFASRATGGNKNDGKR